jgi:hypothetical protein
MGYHISVSDSKFFIPADKKVAAMTAVRELGTGGWVDEDFRQRATLERTLECWRWLLNSNDQGDIVGLDFEGQKLGDDEQLFRVLAPFVRPGSYIEVLGEEGYRWRWTFVEGEAGTVYLEEQDSQEFWGVGDIGPAISSLLESEDDTGCSEDLTVVSKKAIENLRAIFKGST